MSTERIHRNIERSPEDKARIIAVRERFQRERPTPEQLVDSGEYEPPIPLGQYLEFQQAILALRKERERAGLSLADVSERSGIDRAAISRLENGRQPNPTLDTLCRYAAAIGKQVVWSLKDLPASSS
jgi:DNA-binding XRE family transcriptional regulator